MLSGGQALAPQQTLPVPTILSGNVRNVWVLIKPNKLTFHPLPYIVWCMNMTRYDVI